MSLLIPVVLLALTAGRLRSCPSESWYCGLRVSSEAGMSEQNVDAPEQVRKFAPKRNPRCSATHRDQVGETHRHVARGSEGVRRRQRPAGSWNWCTSSPSSCRPRRRGSANWNAHRALSRTGDRGRERPERIQQEVEYTPALARMTAKQN